MIRMSKYDWNVADAQEVRIDDWSEAVSPFWGAVIRSALSAEGVMGLMKAGWTTVKVCAQLRRETPVGNLAACMAPAMLLSQACCAGRHRDAAHGPRTEAWFDQVQSNHGREALVLTRQMSRQVSCPGLSAAPLPVILYGLLWHQRDSATAHRDVSAHDVKIAAGCSSFPSYCCGCLIH